MPQFDRYVGIDYSGSGTPVTCSPKLRIFEAGVHELPSECAGSPIWTRRAIAEWLIKQFQSGSRLAVGIDHAFSFPEAYFQRYGLEHDWHRFLEDFEAHWPTRDDGATVQHLRPRNARTGDPDWLRMTEKWTVSAKSVFKFDVPGQVAHSTHAGIPWLQYIYRRGGGRVHF